MAADVLVKPAAAWLMNMTPGPGSDRVEEGGLFDRPTLETVDKDGGDTNINLVCWDVSSVLARFPPVLLASSAWREERPAACVHGFSLSASAGLMGFLAKASGVFAAVLLGSGAGMLPGPVGSPAIVNGSCDFAVVETGLGMCAPEMLVTAGMVQDV